MYNECFRTVDMASDSQLPGEITSLLIRWQGGDRDALGGLVTLGYDDLRAIAAAYLRRQNRTHTLQATGLVHELYLRLARQNRVQLTGRHHFFTFAAMMMRRILTDYARQSRAAKRSGGSNRVPLHEDLAWVDAAGDDMLMFNRALDELEAIDERAVRVVDLRFFLGCTNCETAELLDVSKATVDRDLEYAKAWLYRRLTAVASPGNGCSDAGGTAP